MNRRAGLCMVLHAAAAWVLLIQPQGAGAQADEAVAEYQVKAAYLYKFLDFVEWPVSAFESAKSPFIIGVVGADPLAEELEALIARRRVDSRPALTRRFHAGELPHGVHVMFVGRDAAARAAALLAAANKRPVLTVTETEESHAAGSVINFVVVDKRVRFDVALRRAEPQDLKISSRLLSVARRVEGAP